MPIEKGDVNRRVRRMIVDNLLRSALIAYESHPRDLREDIHELKDPKESGSHNKWLPNQSTEQMRIRHNPVAAPIWGDISHPGWSSPTSHDLPNLQYEPVILELPHLIEAKAVSLAPPDPGYALDPDAENVEPLPSQVPNALAVDLLQRPATTSLRDYITHLSSIDMIDPPSLGADFLILYEKARFSGSALQETEFRKLMSIFAEILRGMKELDPEIVAELHAEDDYESDIDGDGGESLESTETVEHTPFHTPLPYAGGFFRPADGYVAAKSNVSLSGSEGSVHTAPSRARAKSRATTSVAASSRPRADRKTSLSSLRKFRTASSASSQRSGGSVIRLSEARGPLDLPYTIVTSSVEDMGL